MSTIYQDSQNRSVYDYNGATYDAHSGAVISGSPAAPNPFAAMPPVKNEPAVISSVSGDQNFQTKIQPIIDTANKITQSAAALQKERAAAATTAAQTPNPNAVPPDVQAELDASKSPENKAYEDRLANYTAQETAATNTYNGLTLAATAAAQTQIATLTAQWQQRRALIEQSNKANEANWTQQFIRTGGAEYSPGLEGIGGDFITQKEQEGAQRVKASDDEYNAKVNEINSALNSNNFRLAAELTQDLQGIQQNALTLMQKNAKESNDINTQLRQKYMDTSRDTAIATLIGNGVTDPAQIFSTLSKNGYSVTSDQVATALKNFTISGNSKDISSDLQTFQYVRDNFGLPEDIASLPSEQQYFAYLQKVKQASAAPAAGFTLGANQKRFDANGKLIASGPPGKTTPTPTPKPAVPTWEQYLAAAEKAAGVSYFMAPDEDLLRGQYETEYGGTHEKFTPTELKKLEQAGLANATRQQQLDYLYGKKKTSDTGGGTVDIPDAIK